MKISSINKIILISSILILSLTQNNLHAEEIKCTSTIKNASYTGPYKGEENNLSVTDFTRDLFCAEKFVKEKFPKKFVTIFGSSRISAKNKLESEEANVANDKLYQQVYNFAHKWTEEYGTNFPIMTGAGPGIMEAGSRGAMDAGGPSIGYTTYYGPSRNDKGGDASKAFWDYPTKKRGKRQTIITDGVIFSSVAIRESVMIMHSAAMVFAPGGTGTEWEIYQTIEQIKSNQLKPVPIYIVGSKKIHWQSFYNRLDDMVKRGTIKRHEVEALFVHVDNAEDVFKLLRKDFDLN